jgi:hypothetical protein
MPLISEQDLFHELISALPAGGDTDLTIDLVLVALRPGDPALGGYRQDPGVLVIEGTPELIDAIRGEYPSASALLIVCGNLVDVAGLAGYGQLLVRAGAVAHSAARAALASGLFADVQAANHPALTRLVTERSGGTLRQLLTVILGGGE